MNIKRLIPCLLLRRNGLVKTVKFGESTYIGDPINAVKIFNEKEADELVFLDIDATKAGKEPSCELIRNIASECFMPFSYGGGVNSLVQIETLLKSGAEKIVINTAAFTQKGFIKEASRQFGSSTIVVSVDVKRSLFGNYSVFVRGGSRNTGKNPVEYAKEMEEAGAGEIFLNNIDRDGTMKGYDIDLIKSVSRTVSIPVIACGGAGSIDDLRIAVTEGGASAAAAGSLFVFHGPRRAVLITYPSYKEISSLFQST